MHILVFGCMAQLALHDIYLPSLFIPSPEMERNIENMYGLDARLAEDDIYPFASIFLPLSPKCFLLSHKRIHSIQDTYCEYLNTDIFSLDNFLQITPCY